MPLCRSSFSARTMWNTHQLAIWTPIHTWASILAAIIPLPSRCSQTFSGLWAFTAAKSTVGFGLATTVQKPISDGYARPSTGNASRKTFQLAGVSAKQTSLELTARLSLTALCARVLTCATRSCENVLCTWPSAAHPSPTSGSTTLRIATILSDQCPQAPLQASVHM